MDQKVDLSQLFDILTHDTVNSIACRHGGTAKDCELRGIVARTAILALEPRDGTEITMACRAVMFGSMSDDALAEAGAAIGETSRNRAKKEAAASGRQQMACLKAIQSHRAEKARRSKAVKAAKAMSQVDPDLETVIPVTIRSPAAETPAHAPKQPAPALAGQAQGTSAAADRSMSRGALSEGALPEGALPEGALPEQNIPGHDLAKPDLMIEA